MVYVVLRDGRVLQYNDGGRIPSAESGMVSILTADGNGLLARIPIDVVERIEFEPPCKVFKIKKTSPGGYYNKV